MKKSHIVLAVSAILLIALFSRPVSLSAMEKANAKADISGKCGENISYNLDTTRGILTLTGSGETYNYTTDDSNPPGHPDWYTYKNEINHVVIGEGITRIGDCLFYELPVLLDVSFPSTLTHIGQNAFQNCGVLQEVRFPTNLEEIERYAFKGCKNMKSISFPESCKLTTVYRDAFAQCLSLTSVSLPDNLTTLWYSAFEGDTDLASVELPSKMTELVDSVFKDCTSLRSVTFPSNLSVIGNQVFRNCSSLTSVTLPASLKETGSAFLDCTGLKEAVFNGSLDTLGANTFGDCTSLEKVTFKGNVNSMGMYTFRGCKELKEIRCLGQNFVFGTDPFHELDASAVSMIKLAGFNGTNVENSAQTCGLTFKALYRMTDASVSGLSDKTYTGDAIYAAPVVKAAGITLKNGSDYALTYKNNKAIGTATVIITGKDAYIGTITKTFKIVPKGTSLTKLKQGRKKITVKWKNRRSR